RRRASIAALAEQEFAADLDDGLAVILDNVCGRVGLMPVVGQEGARTDGVDRRVRDRHDLALLGRKAGRPNDLGTWEAGAVERLAHVPYGRGGDAGTDQVAELALRAIAADRARRVAVEDGIG